MPRLRELADGLEHLRGAVIRSAHRAAPFVAAAAFATSSAMADEPPLATPVKVRLVWTIGEGAGTCPAAPAIEADVTRRLGSNPFNADAEGSVAVHVTRERGVWSALIEDRPTGGVAQGSRTVTSTAETCDSLASAVGLSIALTIRERASQEPVEPPPAPPTPCPPPPPPPPPPPDPPKRAATLLAGVGASGVLPRFAIGATAGGRVLASERISLGGALTYLPEQRTERAGSDFAMGATWGALSGCYEFGALGPIAVSACASALLGALHVVVWNPTPEEAGARLWGAAALGMRSDWNISKPLSLVASAEALLPFRRQSYVVERPGGAEAAFTQPAVGVLLALGIGVSP